MSYSNSMDQPNMAVLLTFRVILLRFRLQYRIAVQSDIQKMYLQVGLRAEDQDSFRFLCRHCILYAPPRIAVSSCFTFLFLLLFVVD
ncbi:hypothetical protein T12_14694 [Trichinella patagoniensis]|uniref:Uncharacterized protein n=1 Tax=Trichinella patagoniensis TaxID=990121 RepID=A0A0V0Z6G3_9BILA|nr:hypothetical protein T12_14694 [Trichinella patagoniensis]